MDLTITLTNEEADRLFEMKKESGLDDLTAQEYAQEIFLGIIKGSTRRKDKLITAIDDAVIDIGAEIELATATITMHREFLDNRRKMKATDNLDSEYDSILYRFLDNIQKHMDKLEAAARPAS